MDTTGQTRAACLVQVLGADLYTKVQECKLLVVGAGGIGCELLKNLALAGFQHIEVIDLDTIEVTNLNRQFLFQKQHVGQSKAKVQAFAPSCAMWDVAACQSAPSFSLRAASIDFFRVHEHQVASEAVRRFNPALKIVAHHANIFDADFNLAYFERFDLVLNALDNLKARRHVNRMCLAANRPLIESGSAGYLGQVSVHLKGVSECYECQEKPKPKSYPACTIRNTPSAMIHCIVWAKFLFTHLFGVVDDENDVAPNPDDPELEQSAQTSSDSEPSAPATTDNAEARQSTRDWAEQHHHDPNLLVRKLFQRDIGMLLKMDNLWKNRTPPVPVDFDQPLDDTRDNSSGKLPDQRVWSLQQCVDKFTQSGAALRDRLHAAGADGLVWDKDDDEAMDFVCAAANLRARVFHLAPESRFDVKSKAGNIIPAIPTTNAMVAGLIIAEAYKVLQGRLEACRTVYVSRQIASRNKLLTPLKLEPPNPNCLVCRDKPMLILRTNLQQLTLRTLAEDVLKQELCLAVPEMTLSDGRMILAAPDEDDDEDDRRILETKLYPRTLASFNIGDGSECKVTDDLQGMILTLTFRQTEELAEDQPFVLERHGAVTAEPPAPSEAQPSTSDAVLIADDDETTPGSGEGATSKRLCAADEDDAVDCKRSKAE
ncbi:uncharacterized protein MONBRDRAFT_33435 [Monosiga brevicollis MX1]|uniref:SUMO-activating enzyme subunit n=1 Tax=Monosiga brevicollis TaxID=81824 RepID=A9V5E2_MONBE|nr:uncharacterized protein MONBRDRAFT_33435 [Monosiga brevicollis MX1]EDQ87356.1 predicted protein [Monosiga brevicollis MX1]|eukprot:XP_001747969.1 hypothetical protein [Monosiga brevicollis MX1]